MARVTAEQVGEILRREASMSLPPTLSRIKLLQQEEYNLICNVGPWRHAIERTVWQDIIPGYDPSNDPEKKGYSCGRPIPCIFRHTKIVEANEAMWLDDDGYTMALDMIGVGTNLHPRNCLLQYGVFVPKGKEPTRKEIAEANARLMTYADNLISEADASMDLPAKERQQIINDPEGRHMWAAKVRNANRPWVRESQASDAVKCRKCGKWNDQDVAQCSCGMILDFELMQQIQAEQDAMLERLTKPKAK